MIHHFIFIDKEDVLPHEAVSHIRLHDIEQTIVRDFGLSLVCNYQLALVSHHRARVPEQPVLMGRVEGCLVSLVRHGHERQVVPKKS